MSNPANILSPQPSSRLHGIQSQIASLVKKEIATVGLSSPGLGAPHLVNGGMVQPPAGAPGAVVQVIAAGNGKGVIFRNDNAGSAH